MGIMYNTDHIRNFVVIAHIDHGKSTLADRLLELTHSVETRNMKPQLLDQMDLERERGITIKMQPVRMLWQELILNLIDTPGHIDFSYEVSRALAAVEGAVLLVDATQGVQAQTLTNLHIASAEGLTIIPAVNKIDVADARVEETVEELADLLNILPERVVQVSAKTGAGVLDVLARIVEEVPPPAISPVGVGVFRALIFDSLFESHRGIIAYVRVVDGSIASGTRAKLFVSGTPFEVKDVGIFSPALTSVPVLSAGDIGYIVTGIKDPTRVRIGDTVGPADLQKAQGLELLSGYRDPQPVLWASFFPEHEEDYEVLRDALGKLRLNDASLTFEPESSPVLGRSFICGFLGMLHLEIVTERLRREFSISVVTASPSIAYEITKKDGSMEIVSSAAKFPSKDQIISVREPWMSAEIIVPNTYLGDVMTLLDIHEGVLVVSEPFSVGRHTAADGVRMKLRAEMPLREVVSDFFDKLKSVTSGYASLSYKPAGMRDAHVECVEVRVADEPVPPLARIVSQAKTSFAARALVTLLKDTLPRQMFQVKIQAVVGGRIIASETLSALKKDVTGYLYGGDRSRKMKLWKKQKEGKKRLKAAGRVYIPPEVYVRVLKHRP